MRHLKAEGLACGTRTTSNVTMVWKAVPKDCDADMTDARNASQSWREASLCLVSPDMYDPYSASVFRHRPPVTCFELSRSRHFSAWTSYLDQVLQKYSG